MRKCPICGEPLHNREKVCRNCGAFIVEKDVLTEEDGVCKKNCVNALTMIYEANYFASFLLFK